MNFEQTPSSNFLLLNQATTSSTDHSLGGDVGFPSVIDTGESGAGDAVSGTVGGAGAGAGAGTGTGSDCGAITAGGGGAMDSTRGGTIAVYAATGAGGAGVGSATVSCLGVGGCGMIVDVSDTFVFLGVVAADEGAVIELVFN